MLALIAAGMALGPIRIDEKYRDVVAQLGQGTISHRCYGRDDMGRSACSRAIEYATPGRLITVTFYLNDGVEKAIDILVEANVPANDRRFREARMLTSSVAWKWEGVDVISATVPVSVRGWIRKDPGVFVRADRSGVAAVFERSGKLHRFRLTNT
jgi:hypothetical protein